MSTSIPQYTTGTVTSADGTMLGYRQIGSGPGVVLLGGGYLASQHYMSLAGALSDAFSVYVPDRRGRGLSGPHGDRYSMDRECEDLDALLAVTDARLVWGHSSGGLIALRAALTLPQIRKVAVYEPPLSEHGSISTSWIPRFDREVARGKIASALVTFVKADKLVPAFLPRWLLVPLIALYLRREKRKVEPPDVPMEDLIPTQRFDGLLVGEMHSSLGTFAEMRKDVLLMGGQKSPAFLREILEVLEETLPHARRVEFRGVGHEAPIDRGAPERVAEELRAFSQVPMGSRIAPMGSESAHEEGRSLRGRPPSVAPRAGLQGLLSGGQHPLSYPPGLLPLRRSGEEQPVGFPQRGIRERVTLLWRGLW